MNIMKIGHNWIYCFGGDISISASEMSPGLEIERLNVDTIGTTGAKWDRIIIQTNY